MNINKEKLTTLCKDFITLDSDALARLERYAELLAEWNEKINLTAIVDADGILIKHFYDCLLLFKYVDVPNGASVIDVGTGAGFPGLVLKIARPDIKLCLLDSLQKRLTFLSEVLKETKLDAELIHARAEDGARDTAIRERFDIATARAVAAMPVLSEYCLPYVKIGGKFAALKGASAEEEFKSAEKAIKILGGDGGKLFFDNLPDGDKRGIIIINKIAQTPEKYPRNAGKITKQPL